MRNCHVGWIIIAGTIAALPRSDPGHDRDPARSHSQKSVVRFPRVPSSRAPITRERYPRTPRREQWQPARLSGTPTREASHGEKVSGRRRTETGSDLKIGWWHSFQWLGVTELAGNRADTFALHPILRAPIPRAPGGIPSARSSLLLSREDAGQNRLSPCHLSPFVRRFIEQFQQTCSTNGDRAFLKTHTDAEALLLQWFPFDFSLAIIYSEC